MTDLVFYLIVSALLTGILLLATLSFCFLALKVPRSTNRAVLLLSFLGLFAGFLEIILTSQALMPGISLSFELNRIKELLLGFYLMAIPLSMIALRKHPEDWQPVARFMLYFGAASCLILGLFAFIIPDLFTSITVPTGPDSQIILHQSAGQIGPLFHLRNILLTFYMFGFLGWLINRLRGDRENSEVKAFLLGTATAIFFAMMDILQTYTGGDFLFFSQFQVPWFLLGLALFGMSTMGGVILALMKQAREFETASKALEQKTEQAVFLTYFDPLTGLPNRKSFLERMEEQTRGGHRQPGQKALILLDLDQFGRVNHSQGAQKGDLALIEVVRRFKDCIRSSDFLFRMGEDEFTIILSQLGQPTDAAYVGQKILDAMSKPFILGPTPVFFGVSMGIALYPRDGTTPDELLRNSAEALNEAKKDLNAFYFFSQSYNREANSKLAMLAALRASMVDFKDFSLFYQPITQDGRGTVGAEALIRWQPSPGTFVSPELFIPLAEATGLINQIGAWVLKRAFWDLVKMKESGLDLYISINLSAKQLRDPTLGELITSCLAQTGVAAADIQLEITETSLMNDPQAALGLLRSLVDQGFRLALDDFGMGYSSLAYLRDFPIKTLKIDRSFIQRINHTTRDSALVKTMVEMGGGLEMNVVAEGVETQNQLDYLQGLGCQTFQGYYYSQPLSLEKFLIFMMG